MGALMIDAVKYGTLLAEHLPRVIRTQKDFAYYAEVLERLDAKGRAQSPEERMLCNLIARLVEDYEEATVPAPQHDPHEMLRHLMEENGLKQADLLEVFGSRSVASNVVNGHRQISKAHARKLAVYFAVPADLFL